MNLCSLKHFSEHGINFDYQLFDKNGIAKKWVGVGGWVGGGGVIAFTNCNCNCIFVVCLKEKKIEIKIKKRKLLKYFFD